jgi:hypothetical protein
MPLTTTESSIVDSLNKRLHLSYWILNQSSYQSSTMSHQAQKSQEGSTEKRWADEMEEEIEELEEAGTIEYPPMDEMLKVSEAIIKKQSETAEDELDQLLGAEEKEVKPDIKGKGKQPVFYGPPRPPVVKPQPRKPKALHTLEESQPGAEKLSEIQDSDRAKAAEAYEYEESFASAVETTELREELERVNEKVAHMEDLISTMMKERDTLPKHLLGIKEDINKQMTVMLEKLHTMAESDLPPINTSAEALKLSETLTDAQDKLTTVASFASAAPSNKSPLVNPKATLSWKRRFAPRK